MDTFSGEVTPSKLFCPVLKMSESTLKGGNCKLFSFRVEWERILSFVCLFVLKFYGPVNPMGPCRARSVYLTTRLLGRLSPLSG